MTGSSKSGLGIRLGPDGSVGDASSYLGIVTQIAEVAPPVYERMALHLAEVTPAMFADYGIGMHQLPEASGMVTTAVTERSVVAAIGYAGQGLRGTLVAVALESAVLGWVARMGDLGSVEVTDALGEFSNMLLGRLKTRLLQEGVCIQLATPTTTAGRDMAISLAPAHSTWLAFAGDGCELKLRLDAHFEANFAIDPTLAEEAPAEAGEAMLF